MEILTHRLRRAGAIRRSAALMLFCACPGAWHPAPAQTPFQEQHLEAAFLYNFAKFVEWPGDSGAPGSAPLTFCLLGVGQFQRVLEESLAGKAINNRPIVVRQIAHPEKALQCQVVFLGWEGKKDLTAVLEALNGAPVLTVADFEQFASRGGMIQLIKEGNKFRFAINVDMVSRHGLHVSSRLLQLAEVVHESAASRPKP